MVRQRCLDMIRHNSLTRERAWLFGLVDARLTAARGVSASCPWADPERPLLPADHRTLLTAASAYQPIARGWPRTTVKVPTDRGSTIASLASYRNTWAPGFPSDPPELD